MTKIDVSRVNKVFIHYTEHMVRFYSLCLVLGLVCAGVFTSQASASKLIAPDGVCPHAEKIWKTTSVSKQTKAFNCLVNYARVKNKSKKVKTHKLLNKSAKIQRDKIISCGVLSHSPCGHNFAKAFRKVKYLGAGNYKYREAAENIQSSHSQATAKDVFIAFMNSAPHRANILKKSWKDTGISAKRGKNLGSNTYEVIWVNHFGVRR